METSQVTLESPYTVKPGLDLPFTRIHFRTHRALGTSHTSRKLPDFVCHF